MAWQTLNGSVHANVAQGIDTKAEVMDVGRKINAVEWILELGDLKSGRSI